MTPSTPPDALPLTERRAPRPRIARTISAKQLRADCEILERAVLTEKKATEAQLTPYRPGGERNRAVGAHGWWRYHVVLHRTHASGHVAGNPDANGSAAGSASSSEMGSASDLAVLGALEERPVTVPLSGAAPDGAPSPVRVYSKSYSAHFELRALQEQMLWLAERLAAVADAHSADAIALAGPIASALAYAHQLAIWIVTHPGPGIPYEEGDDNPTPPAWIKALAPYDVVRVLRAHESHILALHAVRALIGPAPSHGTSPTTSRVPASWALFFANASEATGERPATLMKTRSVAALLAQVQLRAGQHAAQEAEAKAARERAEQERA